MSKERPPEPLDFFIWTVEIWCCNSAVLLESLSNSDGDVIIMEYPVHPFQLKLYRVTQVDVGLWLEEINLGGYRQIFKENGVNGEYLEGMSMFTTEQILRFIRRCHMKWGDFITLCKELRRIKDSALSLGFGHHVESC
ncbi:uncharacterized protein LOC107852124 isoform X2 [Capsicum annuum]|uniref:uncharacterized protein LOC107852124 isoform X2 n=1 Tax=Capsicum annuum TaxID=4072 RepID=UPI001FB1635B|nr:uncharacterized protein LOC107852124 isoform X2 [Capsicum annuum]